ncbi:MAG: DUF3990 domain-containing protein [Candidatus Ancillula sp.]|jgi:hypothetical protein|nr:DUF3990 domain-containing protein [Candidatus Ancillula sp.]
MKLYHGSNIEVSNPDLNKGRKRVDFGPGFYLTTLPEQAEKWARQKSGENKSKSIVSVYEFHDSDELFHKIFHGYTEEWLMFVVDNRRSDFPLVNYGYDVIFGNIADDKVIRVVNDFIERLKEGRVDDIQIVATLRDLSYQEENNQYCFATKKSLKYLQFKRSYEVK